MTVAEKVAYLKGLYEGLQPEQEKKETKLINAIIETLEEITLALEDLHDTDAALGNEIDDLSDNLSELEDMLLDEDDEDDESLFQVKCPSCEEEIPIDEADLTKGSISCPSCGEELEFDLSCLDGCNCCHDDE